MATIAQYIAEINHQRDLLAGHLVARGIIATADEKLNLLVHKVSLLPSGSTEKTVIFDADHRDGIFLSHNNTLYSLSAFTAVYPDFCSSKNEYALNYSTSIFGWDYSCYTCSTVPLILFSTSRLSWVCADSSRCVMDSVCSCKVYVRLSDSSCTFPST